MAGMSELSERLVGSQIQPLWLMAGMSERSERLVGGQVHPFFDYNPANGGSPPLVNYNVTNLMSKVESWSSG